MSSIKTTSETGVIKSRSERRKLKKNKTTKASSFQSGSYKVSAEDRSTS